MNVSEQLIEFEQNLEIFKGRTDSATATRTVTIYRDVTLYLIEEGKAEVFEDASIVWDYLTTYTPAALYKVANIYRRRNNMPPLNYPQSIYHLTQMKV